MKNNPYSFDKRILDMKMIFKSLIIILIFFNIIFICFQFNQSIYNWMIIHDIPKTNEPGPIGPIGPIGSYNVSIPYINIFISNIIPIVVFPVGLLFFGVFFSIKTRDLLIKNEFINFLNSLDINSTKSGTGIVKINENEILTILTTKNGFFILKKNDRFLTYATSKELLWKIKYYVIYLKEK